MASREVSKEEERTKAKKTTIWGIQNCCPPYETFPISPSFSFGIAITNLPFLLPNNAYWLTNLSFTSAQVFYKPDGTTYAPHCWSFIFDSPSVMSPTIDVTDFTIGPASGSWMHPKDDCTDIIQWRLNNITNFPNVYGTQPCCPSGNTISTPNGVRSCCDPTIQYTLPLTNFLFTSNPLVFVGSALVGKWIFPVGSIPLYTEYGCWEVVDDAVGPLVGTLGAGVILAFPDCDSIDLSGPNSPNIDVCCPSATTECDPLLITPLIKRLETFKDSRDKLLNKGQKYTENSIKQLTDLGRGPRDESSGGGDTTYYSCIDGRCTENPEGEFNSISSCLDNCRVGGDVPEQCCTWCCHENKDDYILPEGCYDWMCNSCSC